MCANELTEKISEVEDIWNKYKNITSIHSKKEWISILQDRKQLSESIFKTQELWNIYLEKYHNNLCGITISPGNLKKVVSEYEQNYSLYSELLRCMSCSPILIYQKNTFNEYDEYSREEYTDDIYLPEFLDSFIYTPDTAGSKWGVNIQNMIFHLRRNRGLITNYLCVNIPYIEKLADNTFLLDTHLYKCHRSEKPVILKTFNDLEKLDLSKTKQYTWDHFLFSYIIYYSSEGYSIYMRTTAETSTVKSRCIKSCAALVAEEENFKAAMLWLYRSKILPYIVWEENSKHNDQIPYIADKLDEIVQYTVNGSEDTYRIVALESGYTVWRRIRQRKFVHVDGSDTKDWKLGEEEIIDRLYTSEHYQATPEENMKHAKQKLQDYLQNSPELL